MPFGQSHCGAENNRQNILAFHFDSLSILNLGLGTSLRYRCHNCCKYGKSFVLQHPAVAIPVLVTVDHLL